MVPSFLARLVIHFPSFSTCMGSFTLFLFHGFGALIRFGGVSVVLFLSLLFVLLRGVVYMMGVRS